VANLKAVVDTVIEM